MICSAYAVEGEPPAVSRDRACGAGRMRRAPKHAGSAVDQARIMRRVMGRAEARQRDDRLDVIDRDLLNVLDRRNVLGYGDGRASVRWLAEQVHRTTRTVRRHLGRLECLGYLEIAERVAGHGGPAVNRYRVLTPDRSAGGWARRRAARVERDRARKAPGRRRSGGGVLTRKAPALTRGRVIAPSGTGDDRSRPPVPGGQADKRKGDEMPMRVDHWLEREDEHGRWVVPKRLGEAGEDATSTPGRGSRPPRIRSGVPDRETREAEVAEAQRRIAELAARGSKASGWRR